MATQTNRRQFRDRIAYDTTTKRAVSMRDGVLEYMGFELGTTPPGDIFRVYRSPATLANAARLTQSIPLTQEHVSLDAAPASPVGHVDTYECIDLPDEATSSTTGVLHNITCDAAILGALETGKRELSLGYFSDLHPSSRPGCDFEQTNIIPHHLAIVAKGRGGPVCSFLDKKPSEKPMASAADKKTVLTLDQTVELNLATIAEMMTQLPELVRQVPLAKLQELLGPLQAALAAATKATEAPVEDKTAEGDGEGDKSDPKSEPTPATDSAAAFQDAVAKRVAAEVKVAEELRDTVLEHAAKFVDSAYTFKGKTTHQIMRDALTTQYGAQVFSDAELPIAFKMLRNTNNNLRTFGDAHVASVQQGRLAAAVGDKEI